MASYQILYWHDIPVQVRARDGGGRSSKLLSPRFQDGVDNAAMAAGMTGSDAYTEGFHWGEAQERDGSAEAVATAVAAELEARFPTIPWRETAAVLRAARP